MIAAFALILTLICAAFGTTTLAVGDRSTAALAYLAAVCFVAAFSLQ
jgi:hypothetical protein